jgi:type II secretory pathway component PulM
MINNLSEREKKLIGVALAMIVGIVLWGILQNISLLFKPSLRSQVEAKRTVFEQMIPKLVKLKKLQQARHEYTNFSETSLFKFITDNKPKLNTDENDEMFVTEVANAVRIQFKVVSFDDLILWLEQLHKKYGISVGSAEIVAIPNKAGYVETNMILQG